MEKKDVVFPLVLPSSFKPFFSEYVPDHEYHADKTAISSSGLKQISLSPKHFKALWTAEYVKAETPALRMGTLVHLALLEPQRFSEKHVVAPNFGDQRTKANKERKQAFEASLLPGTVLITEEEQETIRGCVVSLSQNDKALAILKDGVVESSGWWREPETGIRCRIRPDFIRRKDGWLVDFKTSVDSSLDSFQRSVIRYGYDQQMAFYYDGIEQITGQAPAGAAWVVMEKTPPYDVSVYALDGITLEEGRRLYKHRIKLLAKCMMENHWPGRNEDQVTQFSYPHWKLKQLENGYGLEGYAVEEQAEII